MGTHAMIGVWHEETNEVIASYVHYDGYVEGVGKTLIEHYNDQSRAETVAHGGYLSALFPSYIESRRDAVHNDRPNVFKSVDEYLDEGSDIAGAHYLYLWDGEAWFYAERYGRKTFEEVEMNLSSVL